jgi:GntR family transcriptional regulator
MTGRAFPKTLDKGSMIPLYRRLAQTLERAIREGALPEGHRLPSEQELIRRFGVSRVTVRQAMEALGQKNIVVRKQGMGTFVQRPVMTQNVDELFGFYPALLSKGLNPETRILNYETLAADAEVREKLGLSPGEKILRFIRQYRIDPSLLLVIQMHIPRDLAGRWTKKEAAVQNSFRLLQEKAGIAIQSSAVAVRAGLATEKIGEWLQVPAGSPVLELRRLTFSLEKRPVEYAVLVFPGESYELTTTIFSGGKNTLKVERQ